MPLFYKNKDNYFVARMIIVKGKEAKKTKTTRKSLPRFISYYQTKIETNSINRRQLV